MILALFMSNVNIMDGARVKGDKSIFINKNIFFCLVSDFTLVRLVRQKFGYLILKNIIILSYFYFEFCIGQKPISLLFVFLVPVNHSSFGHQKWTTHLYRALYRNYIDREVDTYAGGQAL